jgi:2'-5' RNA ligase
MSADESALVAVVPEAEFLAKPFHERYDPSAALGVPAHITLLYPFKPPDQIDAAMLAQLSGSFARFAPIAFELQSIRRFPDVPRARAARTISRTDTRDLSVAFGNAALWRKMA